MKILILSVCTLGPLVNRGVAAEKMNGMTWYIIGAIIALFLMGYLIYSLVKPEKF